MSVRIICDSTADLLPQVKNQVTVVPLTVRFGAKEYKDGIDITHREFYEKLVENDTLPSTSQACPTDFAAIFAECTKNGDQAVVITVSSKLSGTYQSAVIAAQDYPEQIFVVDSKNVAIGSGILVELALELAKQGMCAKELAASLESEREFIRVIALLDTLEYLKRGGRISKTAAFAGTMLNIKPVACIADGEIKLLGKARGSKQGNNLLVQEIEKTGGIDFEKPLLLGYTGLSDALLQKYIEDSAHLWKDNTDTLNQTAIGSVIGTHAGPGAIAVAFFSTK